MSRDLARAAVLVAPGRIEIEDFPMPVEETADALETAAGTRAADVMHVTVLPAR